MLNPEGGTTLNQNEKDVECEKSVQSMVFSVFCVGCATRQMCLAIAKKVQRRYFAYDVSYFALPTIDIHENVILLGQNVESAAKECALNAVDGAVSRCWYLKRMMFEN